ARFDDAFQIEMMDACRGADALVCFNRLFDTEQGVAYGGWDLSDRNLRVLDIAPAVRPGLTGTGNICSGRMILEYARGGCESVQLHTFFQLPLADYPATQGSRTQRALHALVFDPEDGLVAGMLELGARGALATCSRACSSPAARAENSIPLRRWTRRCVTVSGAIRSRAPGSKPRCGIWRPTAAAPASRSSSRPGSARSPPRASPAAWPSASPRTGRPTPSRAVCTRHCSSATGG